MPSSEHDHAYVPAAPAVLRRLGPPLKFATWNVNSLRVRLPQVTDWLTAHQPDVLALQETKVTDDLFPLEAFAALGYEAAYAGQKTYNGVAILSRRPVSDVQSGVPELQDDQRRALALTSGGVRVVCLYVPSGEAPGTDKYAYKLNWLEHTRRWLAQELAQHERLIVLGDFNVAPEDRDVHSPQRWAGRITVSAAERQAYRALLDLGLSDAFRLFEQPEQVFSWWDYGAMGFPRNWGLRIDHLLLSPALADECRSCHVDTGPRRHERPSDHAPVVAEFTRAGLSAD